MSGEISLAERIVGAYGQEMSLEFGIIGAMDAALGSVQVYVGGVLHRDPMFCSAGYTPTVGDTVVALRYGKYLVVVGPVTKPRLTAGTITSAPAGSTVLGVSISGVTYSLPFVSSYTSPAVNDKVEVLWRGTPTTGLILGKAGSTSAPTAPVIPPGPPEAPRSGETVFSAIDADTYRGGKWRSDDAGDVIQGSDPDGFGTNEGAWFTGDQPRSTLQGATVTGLDIWLGRSAGGVYGPQACHLYRVLHGTRPAGAMVWGSGPYDVNLSRDQTGWFSLPASLGQELVSSGGSVGIKGSPYMRMFGLTKSGQAGALRIRWTR